MEDAFLPIKVQSIGVIDAILTASLLSGLIFDSGVNLWRNLDDYFESSANEEKGPDIRDSGTAGNGTEQDNYYDSVAQARRGLRWWWLLFHDVAFAVGLGLILGAALALIRSTSLKVHPSKAIKLVRIWLLGNILVVVIVTMSILSAAYTASSCGGFDLIDIVLAWSALYLFVRGVCVFFVWKYLKELTRQLPTLISPPPPRRPPNVENGDAVPTQ